MSDKPKDKKDKNDDSSNNDTNMENLLQDITDKNIDEAVENTKIYLNNNSMMNPIISSMIANIGDEFKKADLKNGDLMTTFMKIVNTVTNKLEGELSEVDVSVINTADGSYELDDVQDEDESENEDTGFSDAENGLVNKHCAYLQYHDEYCKNKQNPDKILILAHDNKCSTVQAFSTVIRGPLLQPVSELLGITCQRVNPILPEISERNPWFIQFPFNDLEKYKKILMEADYEVHLKELKCDDDANVDTCSYCSLTNTDCDERQCGHKICAGCINIETNECSLCNCNKLSVQI